MDTLIISAFPGTGKTYYSQQHPDTAFDLDSSNFNWMEVDGKRVRNPDFPQNYVEHIENNIGKYNYIFISSHKSVRDLLAAAGIPFAVVYPRRSEKSIYIERYTQRGSSQSFIDCIINKWETLISDCEANCYQQHDSVCVILGNSETISDVIDLIRNRISEMICDNNSH